MCNPLKESQKLGSRATQYGRRFIVSQFPSSRQRIRNLLLWKVSLSAFCCVGCEDEGARRPLSGGK